MDLSSPPGLDAIKGDLEEEDNQINDRVLA